MKKVPVSPNQQLGGILYFPRMLDKIRLHATGELREDLTANLGIAMDAWLCNFLRVSYNDVKSRALGGLSDDGVLAWCFDHGHRPNELDIIAWNGYISRVGWNDRLSDILEKRKGESGLADRAEIQTMFDYIDADEGR